MDINLITKKSILEAPIKSITAPMTPWQVYELGLTINNLTAEIYHLLAENCSDQEMVYNMLKNNQIEADTLKERITLHQNCEMLDYYGSRGRFSHSMASEVNQTIHDNFDNEVQYFLKHLDRLLEAIKQRKIPYNTEEIRNFCTKIANDSGDLYQAILDLYPQGETKDAVQDIYNLTRNYSNSRLQ